MALTRGAFPGATARGAALVLIGLSACYLGPTVTPPIEPVASSRPLAGSGVLPAAVELRLRPFVQARERRGLISRDIGTELGERLAARGIVLDDRGSGSSGQGRVQLIGRIEMRVAEPGFNGGALGLFSSVAHLVVGVADLYLLPLPIPIYSYVDVDYDVRFVEEDEAALVRIRGSTLLAFRHHFVWPVVFWREDPRLLERGIPPLLDALSDALVQSTRSAGGSDLSAPAHGPGD